MAVDKEKTGELARLVQEAREALKAAEKFADEHKLSFTFDPAYGMGGTYYGKGFWDAQKEGDDDWYSSQEDGWVCSSSQY